MIIIFCGPNEYAIAQELKKLKEEFIKKNGDSSIDHRQADELEISGLANLVLGNSLFNQERLVIIENLAKNKELAKEIDKYLEQVPKEITLIIVEIKPDKRTSWYKLITKTGKIQEFNTLSENQVATWAVDYAKVHGGQLDYALASFLVQRVGVNQWLLSHEIDKLLTFDQKITKTNIEKLVEITPKETIFQLLDAVVRADIVKAHQLYDQLVLREIDAHQFMGMLAWQIHNMLIVKTNSSLKDSELAKKAGLAPFVVEKNRRVVANLTLRNIKNMIDLSIKTDFKLKQTNADNNQQIKLLIDQIGRIFKN